jgi:hypothetical protein
MTIYLTFRAVIAVSRLVPAFIASLILSRVKDILASVSGPVPGEDGNN